MFRVGWLSRELILFYFILFLFQGDREEKRNFFEKFPFSHEKKSRKNEFLSTKMSKISDFFSFFVRRKEILFPLFTAGKDFLKFPSPMGEGKFFWEISLPACGKGRDCLFISLLSGHPVPFHNGMKWNFFYFLSLYREWRSNSLYFLFHFRKIPGFMH